MFVSINNQIITNSKVFIYTMTLESGLIKGLFLNLNFKSLKQDETHYFFSKNRLIINIFAFAFFWRFEKFNLF